MKSGAQVPEQPQLAFLHLANEEERGFFSLRNLMEMACGMLNFGWT
jgi:hypothetical protein